MVSGLGTSARVRRTASRYHMAGRPLARAGGPGCWAASRAFIGAGLVFDAGARPGGHICHGTAPPPWLLARCACRLGAGLVPWPGLLLAAPVGHFRLPAHLVAAGLGAGALRVAARATRSQRRGPASPA